jgi:hypothetical protein
MQATGLSSNVTNLSAIRRKIEEVKSRVSVSTSKDEHYLDVNREYLDLMKATGEVPSDYDIDSSVQLLPGKQIDTSNRDVVIMARRFNFDPDGFRQGRPLEKDLFYLDPYITCSWCNMVNFVDVMVIRGMLSISADLRKSLRLPPESLPPCQRCNKADYFFIGPHDFSEMIAAREK